MFDCFATLNFRRFAIIRRLNGFFDAIKRLFDYVNFALTLFKQYGESAVCGEIFAAPLLFCVIFVLLGHCNVFVVDKRVEIEFRSCAV